MAQQLSAASAGSGNPHGMTRERDIRRARVSAYVSDRVRAETVERGAAAKLAKATKFTTAHIANVKNTRSGVGDDFVRAIAEHWGMTVEQLEAEAMKRPAPPRRVRDQYPCRAIVMQGPEYAGASPRVQEAFRALRGREGGEDKTVVEWSLDLVRLIEWDRMGLLETRGGAAKPLR